jgi:hypothetical protein
MLFRLSSTTYAIWCDTCLRGSAVVARNAPLVARHIAIEKLRAEGWRHGTSSNPAPDPVKVTRDDSDRTWSGETFCIDCAASATMRRGA